MIKLFWYFYFGIYMLISMIFKIKLKFLRKQSSEAADRYAYDRLRKIADHVLKKSKTTTIVKGLENIPDEPCVFISNHQGIFDAFLFFSCIRRPIAFIAKIEIQKVPFVGSWMNEAHTIYIDRENPRQSVAAINDGIATLKQGYSMIIFPEGTRSLSSKMGTFKKGSLKLATKANAPIVPITLDGTYKVLETGNQVRGNTLHLTIHPPIYPSTLSKEEQASLSETVHDLIEAELNKITKKIQ